MMATPFGKKLMTRPETMTDLVFSGSPLSATISNGSESTDEFVNGFKDSTLEENSVYEDLKDVLGYNDGSNRKIATNLNDKSISNNASLGGLQIESNYHKLSMISGLTALIGLSMAALTGENEGEEWSTSRMIDNERNNTTINMMSFNSGTNGSVLNQNGEVVGYGIGKYGTSNKLNLNKNKIKNPNHIYQRDYSNYDFTTSVDKQKHTLGDSGCGPASAATVDMIYNKMGKGKNKYGKESTTTTTTTAVPVEESDAPTTNSSGVITGNSSYVVGKLQSSVIGSNDLFSRYGIEGLGIYDDKNVEVADYSVATTKKTKPRAIINTSGGSIATNPNVESSSANPSETNSTTPQGGSSGGGSGGSGGSGGGGGGGGGGGNSNTDKALNKNVIHTVVENTKNIAIKAKGNNNIVICNNFDEKMKINLDDIVSNFEHLNNTQTRALKILKSISELIQEGGDSGFPNFSLDNNGLELLLKGI
jgi:uncharacterized membrane protein YgcG